MGTLVSALSELVVGYFTVSPRSGILDVAATVRIEHLWSSACIVIGKRMEALKLYNKLKPFSELVICFEINQTFLQRVRSYA